MELANLRNLDVLSMSEAAELLGVPVRTLNWRVSNGHVPYLQKLPGKTGAYLFDRAAIEALRQEANNA